MYCLRFCVVLIGGAGLPGGVGSVLDAGERWSEKGRTKQEGGAKGEGEEGRGGEEVGEEGVEC